jgi:hypothetical protein
LKRYHLPLIFLVVTLLIACSVINASGQGGSTGELGQAKADLVRAFESVQQAEVQGATNSSLQGPVGQLNLALGYEQVAASLLQQGNITGSNAYATQSITLSNQVYSETQSLGSAAKTNAQYRAMLSYGVALALALVLSLGLIEFHNIRKLFHEKWIPNSPRSTERDALKHRKGESGSARS